MLAETQIRLEEHFAALAADRSAQGYPVYGLEHGLEPGEVETLRHGLTEDLGTFGYPRARYWLIWIAIAAEVGYAYDGDEYWISFAAEMEHWSEFGDRDIIRRWFRDFGAQFQGFTPQGRWARHFSIIAWPIPHSILPRYLQTHFAQHLNDLKYDIAKCEELGIGQVGKLLRARYQGYSSRFRNFLEQTDLISRLVLALRDDDVQATVSPITGSALTRIVTDLERRRGARDNLSAARRVLREARFERAAQTAARSSGVATASAGSGGGLALIARRSSGGSWRLGVALPDFESLWRRSGVSLSTLDSTRVRMSDAPESWMPGRAIMTYAGVEQPLRALPTPLTRPVIEFEHPVDGLSGLLAPKLRIQGASPWLLRIQADGVARQVLGNHVRSSQTYLLVSQGEALADSLTAELGLQKQESETRDLQIYLFEVQRLVTDKYREALARLKLGYALQAHAEPVGLIPRRDGEAGGSIWLPTEEILLRVG